MSSRYDEIECILRMQDSIFFYIFVFLSNLDQKNTIAMIDKEYWSEIFIAD